MLRRALLPIATAAGLLGCAGLLLWGTGGPLAAAGAGTASFDELVGLSAALLAWVVIAWVATVLVVTTLTWLPGELGRAADDVAERVAPAAARRAARLAVGFAIASGPLAMATPTVAWSAPVGVALATTAAGDRVAVPDLPGVGRPTYTAAETQPAGTEQPGWVPERPAIGVGPAATRPDSPHRSDQEPTVVVAPGDCLWEIAAQTLGPDASTAEIASEWPRWYDANRAVVGGDPDLIQPGMVLRPPPVH